MTESSTAETGAKPVGDAAGENKVPVAAIAAERAKTRAAKDDAEAARQELAKQSGVPDINALIEGLAAEAHKTALAEVNARLAPIEAERDMARMAMKLGLNESQANKVMEIGAKNPNLNEQQRLLLARSENPDLFPQASRPNWSPSLHGGLPVTGTSEGRTPPSPEDYTAKMHAATNPVDKQHWAEKAAIQRFSSAYERFKQGSPR